ncbi:MAG: hypothetical protein IPI01_10855 [Ignavibacteriae bacterium]|nr:hypothetical protein [Ignavibacteriota bacterium]
MHRLSMVVVAMLVFTGGVLAQELSRIAEITARVDSTLQRLAPRTEAPRPAG